MIRQDSVYFQFALCFALTVPVQAVGRAEPESRSVLLLYAERSELPAIRAIDAGLREALAKRGGVEVFTEYFDFARFPAERHTGGLIDLLRNRYAGRKLDLVITTGYEALQFALAQRNALFPGAPITYCGIERHQLEGKALPPDITGAALFYDFRRTVELAVKLQSEAREAVCVFGTSEFDRQVGREALAALTEYPQLRVRQVDAVPYADVLKQARALAPGTIVLFVTIMRDATGQTRLPPLVAEELSAASSVPVYGVVANHLDRGLLGGAMMDYAAHGREIGEIAVARLDGRTPAPRDAASSPLLINWRALERWGIAESRVPAEAIVRFKPPSLWEERRGLIATILAVVATQSALIVGLLMNRATRRRAERALAESTERMGLAADAANLGMWVWDVSGDDAWMTEQGRALFGFKPDARIDYAALLDRVHPEDRAAREAAVKRALETQGEYEMEYRVQTPDGGERWVSARGRCVGSGNGKGPKLLGVSMDVTARKKTESEAAQQRAELGHLSRVALMGEMASSLAHELNQPLTGIVNNASAGRRFIAKGRADFPKLDALFEAVTEDGKRAGEILRGIRGMVRKGEEVRQRVELSQIIEDTLRLVRADVLARDGALIVEPAEGPLCVNVDAVQIQQVLLNLIVNASEAMREQPSAERRVLIHAQREDHERVRLSVRDFGPGLPAEKPQQIFEQYFSTKREGLGMGLAIARSIITAHGGELNGANAAGGGACFHFTLPACTEETE